MQKAKILTSLMLAFSALVPLASHAQDHDRDHRGDSDRHEERVDVDRRADREMAHRWNRGERIPPEYRDRQYIIDNPLKWGIDG
jgi:Ni/Co efflux regulator RcnB